MICRECNFHDKFDEGFCERYGLLVDPDGECRGTKPPAGAYKLRCSLCGYVRYGKEDEITQHPGFAFEYTCQECGEVNRITLQHLLDR